MVTDKNTLIFGASDKADRYAYQALIFLQQGGHSIEAVGYRAGHVNGIDIKTGHPELKGIHTVTMYMNQYRQKEHEDYILSLNPKRIIFNPGAENSALASKARERGIETLNACTLVMLRTGQY